MSKNYKKGKSRLVTLLISKKVETFCWVMFTFFFHALSSKLPTEKKIIINNENTCNSCCILCVSPMSPPSSFFLFLFFSQYIYCPMLHPISSFLTVCLRTVLLAVLPGCRSRYTMRALSSRIIITSSRDWRLRCSSSSLLSSAYIFSTGIHATARFHSRGFTSRWADPLCQVFFSFSFTNKNFLFSSSAAWTTLDGHWSRFLKLD